jgi:hypothetical protein
MIKCRAYEKNTLIVGTILKIKCGNIAFIFAKNNKIKLLIASSILTKKFKYPPT